MFGKRMVLTFHGIGEPRPELPFAEHRYWVARSKFIDILKAVVDTGASRAVLFTFDDGNASDLFAAEALAKENLAGKFHLLSRRLNQRHYIGRADARALDSMGMEVGLHGHAHVDWRGCSGPELHRETIEARVEIADAVGRSVSSVAVPFGAYDARVMTHLKVQRFDCICTSDPGLASIGARVLRRTSVKAEHRLQDIIDLFPQRKRFTRLPWQFCRTRRPGDTAGR